MLDQQLAVALTENRPQDANRPRVAVPEAAAKTAVERIAGRLVARLTERQVREVHERWGCLAERVTPPTNDTGVRACPATCGPSRRRET